MSKWLKFFVLLMVFSLALFWLWHAWGQRAYQVFLAGKLVFPLARGLGELPLQMHYIKSHYMNMVPLTALILATPLLGWKKRLSALALALALIIAWHVIFTLTLNHFLRSFGGPTREFYRIFIPAISINSAVPVIIWAVVAWKGVKELLGEIFVRPPSSAAGQRQA